MARTLEPERMDAASDTEVTANLYDLSRINRWLGGNWTLARLVSPYLTKHPQATVLDVGAANGETLRCLQARFPGIRPIALDRAERFLRMGTGARVAGDVFSWPVREKSVDLVICSLFLHHFTDAEVRRILAHFEAAARVAVVAVDLHRHFLASGFLPATKFVAGWHPLTVHDGVISVKASFTPTDLRQLSPRARVRAHWPWFRVSLDLDLNRSQ